MEKVNLYRITIKHDKGIIKIVVAATSKKSAKHMVMEAELCPENAIKEIKII